MPHDPRSWLGLSRRWLTTLLLAAGLGLAAGGAALAQPGEKPDAFIQRLGNETLSILQDESRDKEAKLVELKRVLDEATDLDLIARLVLARHWRTASPEQQEEYLDLFNQLIMKTMAERLSWYTGQTFRLTSSRAVDERDTTVSTEIIRPSGAPPIKVDWRVRQSEAGPKLIDIVAEGISLVVTQRSETNEVVSARGMDGLLAEMRTRIAGQGADALSPGAGTSG